MSSKGVAFVTGASQGIGRAISLRLADDGFDIVINDLAFAQEKLDTLSEEIVGKGRKAHILVGDVSVEAEVEAMVNKVTEIMGGLDVMVANAGICLAKPIVETSASEWDRIFSVNVRGTFLCYKYAGRQMINQGRGGRIIGASSVAGKQGEPHLAAYSSSKFAIRGMTQSAAREFGSHGITVNAYAPGTIDTEMLKYIGDVAGDSAAFYEEQEVKTAVGHNGTPAEIASIVSYLASKEAHFITGQSISVNGGRYFD